MKKRDILILAVLTFLTISVWAFFNVVKKVQKPTISSEIQKEIKPLPQTLESEVWQKLEGKVAE